MCKFKRNNVTVYYNKKLWSKRKSKIKEFTIKLLCWFDVFFVFFAVIFATIIFQDFLDTLYTNSFEYALILCLIVLFSIICMLYLGIFSTRLVYGKYLRLYEVLDYFLDSDLLFIHGGLYGPNPFIRCTNNNDMEDISMIELMKRLCDEEHFTINDEADRTKDLAFNIDVTNYPNVNVKIVNEVSEG